MDTLNFNPEMQHRFAFSSPVKPTLNTLQSPHGFALLDLYDLVCFHQPPVFSPSAPSTVRFGFVFRAISSEITGCYRRRSLPVFFQCFEDRSNRPYGISKTRDISLDSPPVAHFRSEWQGLPLLLPKPYHSASIETRRMLGVLRHADRNATPSIGADSQKTLTRSPRAILSYRRGCPLSPIVLVGIRHLRGRPLLQ